MEAMEYFLHNLQAVLFASSLLCLLAAALERNTESHSYDSLVEVIAKLTQQNGALHAQNWAWLKAFIPFLQPAIFISMCLPGNITLVSPAIQSLNKAILFVAQSLAPPYVHLREF